MTRHELHQGGTIQVGALDSLKLQAKQSCDYYEIYKIEASAMNDVYVPIQTINDVLNLRKQGWDLQTIRNRLKISHRAIHRILKHV